MSIKSDIRSAWQKNGLKYLIHRSPEYIREKTKETVEKRVYNPYGIIDRDQLKSICEQSGAIWHYGTETECEITPPSTGELSDGFQELLGHYSIPPSFVCELSDVRLVGDRVLCQANSGKYILEEMGTESALQSNIIKEFSHLPLEKRLQRIMDPIFNRATTENYDTIINLVPRHGGEHNNFINYGHWITEDLPRLRAYDQYSNNTGRNPSLLIKNDPPSWMTDTLRLMGFSPSDWIEWDQSEATASRLVIPKLSYVHSVGAELQPADRAWVSEQMKSRIETLETENFSKRVFISRQGQDRRKIVNFEEVMDVVSAFGFEVIRPEELTIEDQVRMFHQAETVVGPSGSGLASIIFANDASLIEIKPQETEITVWHILTAERGLQYDCLRGTDSERASRNASKDADIRVDTDRLAETISETL